MRIFKVKALIVCFIFLLFAMACEENKVPDVAGFWQLYAMEKLNDNGVWEDWNGGMQGNLLYDGSGHVALHLATSNYQNFKTEFPNFSDSISLESLKHLTNSYYYMGRYELNRASQIVKHTRKSHSNPKDWGKTVERKYWFSGDTLIIVPVENANSGLRLKWLRE
ncbi:MAG: lipocalin-like domain-containing protein [Bacteroidota bacterium]